MTDSEKKTPPPAIYILAGADLDKIRKWSREPFAGGIPHLYVPEPDIDLITKLRDALSEVVDGTSAHEFPYNFGITEKRGQEIRALAGLSAKG